MSGGITGRIFIQETILPKYTQARDRVAPGKKRRKRKNRPQFAPSISNGKKF
jgi:hypothetical protein